MDAPCVQHCDEQGVLGRLEGKSGRHSASERGSAGTRVRRICLPTFYHTCRRSVCVVRPVTTLCQAMPGDWVIAPVRTHLRDGEMTHKMHTHFSRWPADARRRKDLESEIQKSPGEHC